MTARELLHRVPDAFEGAEGDDAVIQYAISEPVFHVLKDGRLAAHDGVADAPDVTIRVSDADLVKLMRGELNAMSAFMTGKLKVKGDMMLAQKLVSRVDRERLKSLT